MSTQTYKKTVFVLSLAGVLFSGYLSAVKFFSETCAFNESCPFFVGYPACYFGFGLFLVLFLTSLRLAMGKTSAASAARVNTWVSGLGVVFSGYFAYPEVQLMMAGEYGEKFFGLSTCTYGFLFFALIFVISLWGIIKRR